MPPTRSFLIIEAFVSLQTRMNIIEWLYYNDLIRFEFM
jgi:hypothetical protein